MDKLEPEKLEWTLDLPSSVTVPPVSYQHMSTTDQQRLTTSTQARFDLSGLVVPPELNVDTHLGLHHHGDDPQRAGYTIGELFHLARSSVPAQRRLALSTLVSALAQTRRGLHIPFLAPHHAPSLIFNLLASQTLDNLENDQGGQCGVAFLLRYSLDESVSMLDTTCFSRSGEGFPTGSSLNLIAECIRGFACLLCDYYGQALCTTLCDYPVLLQVTNFYGPAQSVHHQPNSEEEDSDHSKLMAADPVHFLFTKGQLAMRLAWLLGPEPDKPRVQLPSDTAGVWLPKLLIRGVLHSRELAYRIFSTPGLFRNLMIKHLPMCSTQPSETILTRPDVLLRTDDVPLPHILQLFRLTMRTSASIRLTMVNEFAIVERCCSYVDCSRAQNDPVTVDSIIRQLPGSMPVHLALHLQVEALRCLSACLSKEMGQEDSIPLHALNYIWSHLSQLMTSYKFTDVCFESYFLQGNEVERTGPSTNETQLMAVLPAWICFLTRVFESLSSRPKLNTEWSESFLLTHLVTFTDSTAKLLKRITALLHSFQFSVESTLTSLLSRGITPVLIGSLVDSLLRLSTVHGHLNAIGSTDRIDVLWNDCIKPLFSQHKWVTLIQHFFRCGSVLTGAPNTLHDVDITVLPDLTDVAGAPYSVAITADAKAQIRWDELPKLTTIDPVLLEPVQIAPKCLPDFGAHVFFRYNVPNSALANFSWPAHGINTDFGTSESLKDLIPLVASMVTTMEYVFVHWRLHLLHPMSFDAFLPLIRWVLSFASDPLPWLRDSSHDTLPYLLVALESELLGRIMVSLCKLVEQQNPMACELRAKLFDSPKNNAIYVACLRLVSLLRHSQKQLVSELFDCILFHPTQVQFCLNFSTDDRDNANCTTYLGTLVETYRGVLSVDSDPSTFRSCDSIVRSAVPENWIFFPFQFFYGQRDCPEKNKQEAALLTMTNVLQWMLCLLRTSMRFTLESSNLIAPLNLLVHLNLGCLAVSCAGSLCFGRSGILMAKLIFLLGPMSRINERLPKHSLSLETVKLPQHYASFYELYVDVIAHFMALSYNSPVFANLILWPCQQSCHMKYRRALWGEHQNALVAIRLRLDQLLIPIANFLEPGETDASVLRVYAAALLSGTVSLHKQPVLFLIAVHHLNRYIYDQQAVQSEFHAQFAKLIRTKRQWIDRGGISSQLQIMDIIRLYKQPDTKWLSEISLQPDEQITTGVEDPLVGTQVSNSSEQQQCEVGFECYTEDSWPPHRRKLWEKYFDNRTL